MLDLIYGAEIEISDILLTNNGNVFGEEQERRLPSRMAPLNLFRLFRGDIAPVSRQVGAIGSSEVFLVDRSTRPYLS